MSIHNKNDNNIRDISHKRRVNDMKRALVIMAVLFFVFGCAIYDEQAESLDSGNTDAPDIETSAGDRGSDETDGCEPGTLGCECAAQNCFSPYVCIDDVCSTPATPPDDGGDTGVSDDGADDAAGDDGEAQTCLSTTNCPAPLVCSPEGLCADALDLAYEVSVPNWAPSSCDGGVFDGDADLFWELRIGGTTIHPVVPWVQGGCPGTWSETVCVEQGGMRDSWFLVLWDEDGADDDLMDSLWWDDDGNTLADPIDPILLHLGEYDGPTGSGGSVRVQFNVVPFCP